ncbi:protein disulfide-isomerase A1, partial [Phenoliferia sp. Uapishka_3]
MRFSAIAALTLASAALASDVLDLTKATFDDAVAGPLTLVEFFAPWCGHCKALAPHYEEAATILKDEDAKLAKVDCTVETDLCAAHGVSGYPTLKVFRRGEAGEYGGSRKTDGIVSYMRKQSLPAVSVVNAENHEEFKAADKIVLIAYFDDSDATSKAAFYEYADNHRDDYLFGLSTDSAKTAGVSSPSVVLYKTFDEGRNEYTGPINPAALGDFVREHSVPLLDEISPENFALYAEAGIPLAYIFVEATDPKREEIVKAIEPVAREHKGKINFVWIDAVKFADHAKSLNLAEPTWPSFAIQNVALMSKYPLDQSKKVDFATVSAFVSDFVAGKVPASVKSEKIPAVQDEPVFVLVADQFDEIVADTSKDLLVEFYAPWCGHCKKLKPTWDTLGEKYSAVKDKITIAKFDATENDVPATAGFKVAGFPTIKFKAAGAEDWITYEGDRSFESLVEFLDANATNDIDAVSESAPDAQVVLDSKHDELVLGSYLLPIAGTQFLEYSLFVVSIVTVGHLGVTELAAASLGSMTANLVSLSIIQGFSVALDTLCPQAFTSSPKDTSLYAMRTLVILTGLLIPQAIILWFSKEIMILLRQDADVAALTATYLRIIILGLPAYALFEVLRRWLQAQGPYSTTKSTLRDSRRRSSSQRSIECIASLGRDQLSGSISGSSADFLESYQCLFTLAYVVYFCPRDAWGGFSSEVLCNLGPNIQLGLAGTAMVASESWAWEIISLASSYLGPKSLAAQSILGSTQGFMFQIPYSLSVAVSIRVGNLLGAQRPKAARAAALAGMVLASVIAAAASSLLMLNRNRFAYLFTNDEEVAALTVAVIPILALFQLFDDVSTSNNGALRGAGRSAVGALINIMAYYPVSLPLGYYLTFMSPNLGLSGIWIGISFAVAASLAISIPIIWHTDWERLAKDALERSSKGCTEAGEGDEV